MAPSYTVGAIAVIERDDGALLLVRHSYRRRWGTAGGLLQRGEDPVAGLRREVIEEVGLEIVVDDEPATVVDPEPQRVDLVYAARPAPGVDPDAARPRSPELLDARWFPAGELPELQHETVTALTALARSRSRSPVADPSEPRAV